MKTDKPKNTRRNKTIDQFAMQWAIGFAWEQIKQLIKPEPPAQAPEIIDIPHEEIKE